MVDVAPLGLQLDSMILNVFSNLNDPRTVLNWKGMEVAQFLKKAQDHDEEL